MNIQLKRKRVEGTVDIYRIDTHAKDGTERLVKISKKNFDDIRTKSDDSEADF